MLGPRQASRRVGSRLGRWIPAFCCLLAFGLTGPAVYLMGLAMAGKSATYRATALVEQECLAADSVSSEEAGSTALPRAPDVRQQILSDGNLQRAAVGLAMAADGSDTECGDLVVRVRDGLSVEVAKPSPNRLRITIAARGQETDGVVQLVNALAEQYAAENHKREATAQQNYQEAKSAAGGARQEMEKAEMRLHTAMEARLASVLQGAQVATPAAPGQSARVTGPQDQAIPSAPSLPAMAENPEWLKLESERQALTLRRHTLLADRTSLHPEVQHVEHMLAELTGRQAGIPRYLRQYQRTPTGMEVRDPQAAEPLPGSAPEAAGLSIGHAQAGAANWPGRENEIEPLRESLDRARQRYQHLAEEAHQAWLEHLRVPQIKLTLAGQAEIAEHAGNASRLLLLALTSALAVAMGVGMISLGAGPDGTFATLAQVESMLPLPILGKVPIVGRDTKQSESTLSRLAGRRTIVVSGLVLILACIAVLIQSRFLPG